MVSQKLFSPRRGDVITIDLSPLKGHEQGGRQSTAAWRRKSITAF
jgi:mRNA-degrading endonuclease toxin of MazEF toxin-antitoxin module